MARRARRILIGAALSSGLLLSAHGAAAARDFYGPAVDDYATTGADLEVMQRALSGISKVAAKLFPGTRDVDVILQDTSNFFIYSRNPRYPYKKVKRWRGYQVYELSHRRPEEHEMWGCAAGPPSALEVADRRIISEYSVRCAPWGAFRQAQERMHRIYRHKDAYLATVIHEFGHVYAEMRASDPTPEMDSLRRRVARAKLPEGMAREAVAQEAYAEWAELAGSRMLYPDHFERLVRSLSEGRARDPHQEALAVAYAQLREAAGPGGREP